MYSGLIHDLAIPTWENERGVLWKELLVNDTSVGTLAVGVPSVNTFNLPTNFKFPYDGQVTVTYPSGAQLIFKVKTNQDNMFNPYGQVREFYVTGNPSAGFQLVPGWTIATGDPEVGATVALRYIKTATLPTLDSNGNITNLTAIPEMSDPMFIVYKVGAQVSMANYNANMYQVLEDKANYSLKNMRLANSGNANYEDNYVKDVDDLLRHQGRYRNAHINPGTSYNYDA